MGISMRARPGSLQQALVTLCVSTVAFLGWRASLIRHVDEQQALVQSISNHGGLFARDTDFLDPPTYGPPEWVRALMGQHYFSNIVSINLGATAATDENVKKLAKLKHLQSLGIWRTHISDSALAAVGRLRELETLDISQTDITDDGLAQLTRLQSVRVLVVGGDRITDQGLSHLKAMSRLNMLCVVGNQFSATAKKDLERSLPDTTVVFVPLPQVAAGAPQVPIANPGEPAIKPQRPAPNQAPPGRKFPAHRGPFT